jgi:hypothetical protein
MSQKTLLVLAVLVGAWWFMTKKSPAAKGTQQEIQDWLDLGAQGWSDWR